jgi:uncharacterized protein
MDLSAGMRDAVEASVLCWLATADAQGQPNVSPKEVFAPLRDGIVIAHIASPRSVRNIAVNPRVSVVVLDVFAQEGWKFTGRASLIAPGDELFGPLAAPLEDLTQGLYPILSVIRIDVDAADRIVAPSSWMYPDRPADVTRAGVLARYGVQERD